MKKLIIPLLCLCILIVLNACMRDHSVMDPVEQTDYRQLGMIINKSFYYPLGIDTLYVNENDTIQLSVSTILLNPHQYQWKSNAEDILTITPDPTTDSLALAIAVGDSGMTTSFTIYDQGNDVSKTVPFKVMKYWADPLIFELIGEFGAHYYYISNHKKTWLEGKLQCEISGGHLLTITSAEENRFIAEAPLRINEDNWIGLTYLYGNFPITKWITEEPLIYRNFLAAYTGTGPGDFAEYYFFMNPEGKWNQQHEKINRYILEME